MRIVVTLDGERHEVEVDLDRSTARRAGLTYPVKVVQLGDDRVELEIAGEKVVVEGWTSGARHPAEWVAINGERYRAQVEIGPTSSGTRQFAPVDLARPGSAAAPSAPTAEGIPVVPPMPGKVIEVRIREGERVTKGQVLLVLEAMKMRNEVLSPADGLVHGLAVAAGANVRARETMLLVRPS
jgi:biotin carboxyl carrier protein